ncbi:leucyl aminopeptidase [Pseudonocardia oroxyli]|uniref:Probable cytosol aminopeptidase n=1 Tax=Pseudonocardia oroxyli TaxID=366584 RepID=A0A1G7ZYY9_PSEOR|nr:leucyl aminopeptidase [Pseudonocardia oroxyli]
MTTTAETQTRLAVLDGAVTAAEADVLVVGLLATEEDPVLAAGAEEVDAAFSGELAALLALGGATGKLEEVVRLPGRGAVAAPVVVGVGLGKEPTSDDVRRAAGAVARALGGTARIVSTLGAVDPAAAAEGTLLGAYRFTAFKGDPTAGKGPIGVVEFAPGDADVIAHASTVAEAVLAARDLINTPPNALYPETFAARARELGEAAGLEVEVLDDDALLAGGYGGIMGVGQGSSRKPRLVRLRWSGGSAPVKKVALVGKGITFDTGGISIKPAAGMDHMTSDMSGAAAVIATTVAAARLQLPVAVTATVPMAENMPSDTAYRPGDVLTMYGGKTVEVLNTDAEGRLILADAMVRAAEDEPDYLVETSTLTGAQMVALGTRTAGIMGSEEFRDRVAALGRAVGEDAWAMPLPPHLRPELDSRIADLANVTGNRFGGMLAAGIFLREFVAKDLPWAHVDIAGPSFNTGGAWGYTPKGGTGVPVRTLVALLEDVAANG